MGYAGDRKGLGEALQELDPTAKIPGFKIYGKNSTAKQLKGIMQRQRISQLKNKVKPSEYGFKLGDEELFLKKPFSPMMYHTMTRVQHNYTVT